MKTYTKDELKEILAKHCKWVRGEQGGERAYLQGANLQGADLRYAYLQGADLQGTNLQGADLRYAYLQGADLRYTILENINWLSWLGIVPDSKGKARAYKVTKADGQGICYNGIDYADNTEFKAELDNDVYQPCGEGVNLATLSWCLNNKTQDDYRLFMLEFDVTPDNVCVPVASDGKFRVAKARKVGECDWNGNLLEVAK